MEDFSIYLQPTEFFDFDKKIVQNQVNKIVKDLDTVKKKAIALFYWVRDEIKYNMATYLPNSKSHFKASVTLRRKNGFCVSKSILLSSFARAIGIPARIHLVDLINHKVSKRVIDFMGHNVMYYHAYSEFFVNGKWLKLTPSFDKGTAIKGGFLPMVEFNGEIDAIFPPYDNQGNLFGEYIKDRGVYADLPLEEIDRLFEEKYEKYARYKKGLSIKSMKGEEVFKYKK